MGESLFLKGGSRTLPYIWATVLHASTGVSCLPFSVLFFTKAFPSVVPAAAASHALPQSQAGFPISGRAPPRCLPGLQGHFAPGLLDCSPPRPHFPSPAEHPPCHPWAAYKITSRALELRRTRQSLGIWSNPQMLPFFFFFPGPPPPLPAAGAASRPP